MRILHVAKTQQVAGAENYLFELLPLLSHSDFDVHFLNLYDQDRGDVPEKYRARLEKLRTQGISVHESWVRHSLDFRSIYKIEKIVEIVSPDLVHTHMPFADLMASAAAKKAEVPKVVSSRHYDYTFSWMEILRFATYYAVANHFQDSIIAVSSRVAELSRRWERWKPAQIHVVPHGCKDQKVCRGEAREKINEEFNLPPDAFLIGTVARLIHWKGHKYAVEAMRTIKEKRNDVFWFFIGDGPDREELEQKVQDIGLSDRLIFLGFRSDVPTLLGAMDLMVHPTTGEAFGIALIEAMSQGTPIIGTNTGAIPEIVKAGETGMIVPPKDSPALAEAVQTLADDRKYSQKIGRAGRRRHERRFTLDKMVRQTIKVYQKTV